MAIHPYRLVFGAALTTTAVLFAAGCSREEPPTPTVSAPPPITVGTEIDDAVVTTKVKSALLADPGIKGFDIKVETRKGMVQISGFVDNQTQIDRVLSAARAVDGAKGVENGMTIKDGKATVGNKVDDSIVTTRVKTVLLADPNMKSFDVAVVTNKGDVQLSGFVNNQMQMDRAVELARAVDGVQRVTNEMSIKK